MFNQILLANTGYSDNKPIYTINCAEMEQGKLNYEYFNILDPPGKENPSDVLTKTVDRATFRKYMAKLYNNSESTF